VQQNQSSVCEDDLNFDSSRLCLQINTNANSLTGGKIQGATENRRFFLRNGIIKYALTVDETVIVQ